MSMLEPDDFRPVTLDDKQVFADHYQRYPPEHSDNTFANIICWNHYAHYCYARKAGAIILSSTIEGRTKFRPPLGPMNGGLLTDIIELCLEAGDDTPLVLIDSDAKEWLNQEFPKLPLYPDRNYFEYVYLASDLAMLPGRNYLGVRRQLNKFRKNCHPVVETIDRENKAEVTEFLVQWCEWKNCEGEPFLFHEREAIMQALDYLDTIGLSGILIRVLGKVGAISLSEPLNANTVVVHFEKGLPDCEGIYKAINAETAIRVMDNFRFINRESDMGVPGLREAKLRYHPHHLTEVYYAKREDLEVLL
ncbi:MAG: phosphatidylglycerol lysyltransferase domain-containing protein [Methanoregulaceae archaeon]|jgi:hypothetical protein|nr:phosphatidylglycerol lysyltransferase domain-containing protein [Methanoregulaceae archaeon]